MAALEDQSVLITGGASGLGQAVVARFIEEGAWVTVLDRAEDRLAQIADIHADRVATLVGDVRSSHDNAAAVSLAIARFGKLDCAIGNAGIWDFNKSLSGMQADRIDAAFDELMGINVKGYLHLAKAALPALVRSQGSLIFTVSNAGFHPNGGGPLYTASKHAVVGLIRQLAFELAPVVKVNGVAPGPIDTQLSGAAALEMDAASIAGISQNKQAVAAMPLQRVPQPEDYAGAYVYLASPRDNRAATGGIVMNDVGIGVRGIGISHGGSKLHAVYGSEGEQTL